MKIVYAFILIIFVASCDNVNSPDCLQTTGDIVSQEFEVDDFDKIIVNEWIVLQIEQGPVQQVIVETGNNLLNDIEVNVVDRQLIINNKNGCNLVRDYRTTIVRVTVPELKELRSSTGFDVRSQGLLNFESLTLFSESFQSEFNSSGDFYLDLNVRNLRIVSNNLSNFYLNGYVENATLEWFSGDGQLFAQNLEIQNAQIFHRGTNRWQMDVKQNIAGSIVGYGDVILESAPAFINVQETWEGRLIIKN